MKKIPTIYLRDLNNMSRVLNERNPECEWVFNGVGAAMRKYDGTCCKVEGGVLYKRREVKRGKPVPADFIEEQLDPNTGKRVGWVPVDCTDSQDKWHCVAFDSQPDGTYELCGPKIQGNPEDIEGHMLISHKLARIYTNVPRTFVALKEWITNMNIEGIVFLHYDGRMAKIKKRDFGLKR